MNDKVDVPATKASKSAETELREAAAAFAEALAKAKEAGLHFDWPANELAVNDIAISQGAAPVAYKKVK